MQHAGDQSLVRNSLLISASLKIHQVGCRKSNVHALVLHKGGTCGFAECGKLGFRRTSRYQHPLFICAKDLPLKSVNLLHRSLHFRDNLASPCTTMTTSNVAKFPTKRCRGG